MRPALAMILCLAVTVISEARAGTVYGDAVVLPPSFAAELLRQCTRKSPEAGEGGWTPQRRDIAVLERALPRALMAKRAVNDPDLSRAPSGWRRQYVGIVRGGRRLIYGSFFPRKQDAKGWRSRPIIMCHGGAAIFGVEYDVAAARFTDIAFNGGGPPLAP